jgi:hypothetical protein
MANKQYYEGIKSPFNFESLDSGGERKYAEQLDADNDVLAWTKAHKIIIRYRNKKGFISKYYPDFLVRRKNQNELEIIEIKGSHLKDDPNVECKRKAADDWCFQRGMKYKLIVST